MPGLISNGPLASQSNILLNVSAGVALWGVKGWTGAKLRPVVSLGKEGQVGKPASFVEDGEDGEDDAGSCCQRRGSCGGS